MYSSQAINRLSVCLWPFVLNPPVLSSSRMKILNRGRCRLRPQEMGREKWDHMEQCRISIYGKQWVT